MKKSFLAYMTILMADLAGRGNSKQDLGKILGGNVQRVMRQVAQVSKETQKEGSSQ